VRGARCARHRRCGLHRGDRHGLRLGLRCVLRVVRHRAHRGDRHGDRDNTDVDFYKFEATSGSTINVSLGASGPTSYNSGTQNADGSCSAGTALNPRTIHDLNFQVLQGAAGSIVLHTGASAAAGSTESVTGLALPATGTYYVRVYPSTTTDDVQMYSLTVTLNLAPAIPGDLDNNGQVNGGDLGIMLALWGPVTCGNSADLNGDCVVDGADLGTLLSNWG